MNEKKLFAIGIAILRVTLGIVLVAHSLYLKVMVFGIPGTVGFFHSLGLPGIVAYLTIAIEIIAGLALIFGFQSRLAAIASVPVLLGATWAHSQYGWLFCNANGGWEYPLILVIMAIVIVLTGGGYGARKDALGKLKFD